MTLVEIDGHELKLSNLDKVLYPAPGFTKGEVIDYYARVAPTLLPHLGDRAITLKRYPDGVDGKFFYEKNCPRHHPNWVPVQPVRSEDGFIEYCQLDSVAAVVWAANLASLELHTTMARAATPDNPTMVVFDLDPGPPADILDCADVALWIRDLLAGIGLDCVAKTSGSKGLQVYLPLNGENDYDHTTGFAKYVAELMEREEPGRVVSVQKRDLRRGKVLVDWMQNSFHKTTVCAYSLRAREQPTVSTPVTWTEVEAAHDERDAALLTFTAPDVLDRIAEHGDLWAPTLTLTQSLPPDGPTATAPRVHH
ncbi:MAG TPA: non-homologous end-joining DNA ligase [Acidimicrobiales bacterium]|nr:non-homologous end-joining DNA ligase [Acidimicrobiales bacterium]